MVNTPALMIPLLCAFAGAQEAPASEGDAGSAEVGPGPAATDPSSAEPAAATSSDSSKDAGAEAAGRVRVLTLKLEVSGIDETTADIFQGDIGKALSRYPEFEVMTSSDLAVIANLEGQKAMLGCEENSCLAELAGALGARYIVYGRLGSIEDIVVLQVNLFDSEQAKIISRHDLRGNGLKDTLSQIEVTVDKLVTPIAKSSPASTTRAAGADSTEAPPDEGAASAAEDEGGVLGTVLLVSGIGLLGVGVVGALAAGATAGVGEFRLSSHPSSRTPLETEAWTWVGPAALVGVAALGVIALAGGGLTVWGVLE